MWKDLFFVRPKKVTLLMHLFAVLNRQSEWVLTLTETTALFYIESAEIKTLTESGNCKGAQAPYKRDRCSQTLKIRSTAENWLYICNYGTYHLNGRWDFQSKLLTVGLQYPSLAIMWQKTGSTIINFQWEKFRCSYWVKSFCLSLNLICNK